MKWLWCSICAVGLVLIAPQQSQCNNNVLIVENVDRLRVFNRYQQEITPGDRRSLVPFVPMKILKANGTLGDGFTECMQVEIEGEVFYLLKDGNGDLTGKGSLGFEKTFNTTILIDTVQILASNAVRFSPIHSSASTLSKGEIVIRVFRSKNLTYCRTSSAPPTFGWIDFGTLKEGRIWNLLKHDVVQGESLSSLALQRIRVRMSEVNAVLGRLFGFFNSQTHEQKPAPQWNILSSEKTILCTLEGSVAENDFQQSTLYLSNEIENILLGSTFQVTHVPGRIEINPR